MQHKCPGAFGSATPVIKSRQCPSCGAQVEMFSTDARIDCPECGQPVFNNLNSCARYCAHAEQCLGVEAYRKVKK